MKVGDKVQAVRLNGEPFGPVYTVTDVEYEFGDTFIWLEEAGGGPFNADDFIVIEKSLT